MLTHVVVKEGFHTLFVPYPTRLRVAVVVTVSSFSGTPAAEPLRSREPRTCRPLLGT